jgi:hypothetical protein
MNWTVGSPRGRFGGRSDAVHGSSLSSYTHPSRLTLYSYLIPFFHDFETLLYASRHYSLLTWHENSLHYHSSHRCLRVDNNLFRLMRPAGARQRGQPPQRPGASRNEAFENIFGRPAVGHHLGQTPNAGHAPPPAAPGASYGYTNYPAAQQSNGNTYLNPAQPSLPPGHGFAAPPPRTASYGHSSHAAAHGFAPAPLPSTSQPGQPGYTPRQYESSSSGHSRPVPSAYGGSLSAQVSLHT